MARSKLLFDYTVLDSGYTHGKFQFITGDDGAPAANLDDPADTRIDDIGPYADMDPVVFSYMDGTDQTVPRVLLCNVTTNFSTSPATSTGKYSVCVPTSTPDTKNPGSFIWTWAITGYKDLQLVDSNGDPVLGNPYGVAQVGNFLYLVEYDTANIYTLNITNFESASGPNYPVNGQYDASGDFLTPPTVGTDYAHGAAILILTNGGETYLYALFTVAQNGSGGYPESYSPSALVQYQVNTTTGALTFLAATEVGANATALVPAPNSSPTIPVQDAMAILVPAIGGVQGPAVTQGTASSLSVVPAFATLGAAPTAPVAFTGDPIPSPAIFPAGNYDIKSMAVSDDGNYAYLLTATYSSGYLYNWGLFQTTAAKIIAAATATQTLSAAVTAGTLVNLDSTADIANGDPGVEWELQYENAASPTIGRLWFVKGSPIRISMGNSYSAFTLFNAGSEGPLYSPAFNVNSADLIGETIYAAAQGVSKDTRLIKGSSAQTTTATSAASDEEEEK
jgi:hypothetical protein